MRVRRTRGVRAATAGLVLAASAWALPLSAPAESITGDVRIGVPAYFWPGSAWDSLTASAGAVDLAVVNVDSGPGSARLDPFVQTIAAARARGVRVLGYVHTRYGARPIGDAETEIDHWFDWYGVDGVFFDEVPSDCSLASYYDPLAARTRSHLAATVVINPGTNAEECTTAYSDVIVNFEGTAASYTSWVPSTWTETYPRSRFWNLVYGASAGDAASIVALSRQRNAGHVYVTDGAMPNPWSGLPGPSVWSEELVAVAGRTAAPVAGVAIPLMPRAAAPHAASPGAGVADDTPGGTVVVSAPSSVIALVDPPVESIGGSVTGEPSTGPIALVPIVIEVAPAPVVTTGIAQPTAVAMVSAPTSSRSDDARPTVVVLVASDPVRTASSVATQTSRTPWIPAPPGPTLVRLLPREDAARSTRVTARRASPAPCPGPGQRVAACAATAAASR